MMEIKKRNPKIYLMCGKAKHGKDTFSAYLKEEYEKNNKKVIVTQLSKYIKYYAREMTGWNLSEEDKPRELLQQLGTGVIREYLKKDDLFINRMIEDIEVFSCFYDAIIISDVRLKKEIIDLKREFPELLTIYIHRPNFDNGLKEEEKKHFTEVDLDDYNKFDYYLINDSSIEKLKDKVLNLIEEVEHGK